MSFQLDAKNSPLALLAQTCSSIGSDVTPPHKQSSNTSSDNADKKHVKDSTSGASNHSGGSPPGGNEKKTPDRGRTKSSPGERNPSRPSHPTHDKHAAGKAALKSSSGHHRKDAASPLSAKERCSSVDKNNSRTSSSCKDKSQKSCSSPWM